MAGGFPQIQPSFGAPAPPPSKQQPQVPFGFGGYTTNRPGGGQGVNQGLLDDLFRRRRPTGKRGEPNLTQTPEELERGGSGPAIPPSLPGLPNLRPSPPPRFGNPYKGIPHFENYSGGIPLMGDALSFWNKYRVRPGQGGDPTRERVTEISQAQDQLEGRPVMAPSGGVGQGLGIDDLDSWLRRLLAERGY